jgi:predicted ATPase
VQRFGGFVAKYMGDGVLVYFGYPQAHEVITSGLKAFRSTGATASAPMWLSYLARAHAGLDQFDDARRCIGEAITAVETTKEKLWEAETNRIAGEIALKSPEPQAAEAQAYFERALAVARQQQAKSWELRAAMSMARLGATRGSGKRPASFSLRSTTGSRRASTRSI